MCKFTVILHLLPMQSVRTVVLVPVILNNVGALAKGEELQVRIIKKNKIPTWMAHSVVWSGSV